MMSKTAAEAVWDVEEFMNESFLFFIRR